MVGRVVGMLAAFGVGVSVLLLLDSPLWDRWWGWVVTDARWRLFLACGAYAIVGVITNRGLIAAPSFRRLQFRTRSSRAELSAAIDVCSNRRVPACVESLLSDLEKNGVVARRLTAATGEWSIALTKLEAGWRTLRLAERLAVQTWDEPRIAASCVSTAARLEALGTPEAEAVAQALRTAPEHAIRRALLVEGMALLDDRTGTALEAEFDEARTGLWLTFVGLLVVFAVGLAEQSQLPVLLVGAVGGFLSPMVASLLRQRTSSWGVIVLSPVGGALTAFGGLLLLRFLASPSIGVFDELLSGADLDRPGSTTTLALALLLGFSGRVFSRLAISAAAPLTGADATSLTPDRP